MVGRRDTTKSVNSVSVIDETSTHLLILSQKTVVVKRFDHRRTRSLRHDLRKDLLPKEQGCKLVNRRNVYLILPSQDPRVTWESQD